MDNKETHLIKVTDLKIGDWFVYKGEICIVPEGYEDIPSFKIKDGDYSNTFYRDTVRLVTEEEKKQCYSMMKKYLSVANEDCFFGEIEVADGFEFEEAEYLKVSKYEAMSLIDCSIKEFSPSAVICPKEVECSPLDEIGLIIYGMNKRAKEEKVNGVLDF